MNAQTQKKDDAVHVYWYQTLNTNWGPIDPADTQILPPTHKDVLHEKNAGISLPHK